MDTTFLLRFVLLLPFLIQVAPMDCSCYSFHEDGLTWAAARQACQHYGGDLISMEAHDEWQVIKDHIQNLKNLFNNDWHIGLRFNATVAGNWTWVSGKPLTINRWQPRQPRDDAPYVVMAKNHPPGTKGLFKNVRGDVFAGFICEKTTDCSRRRFLCKDPQQILELRTTTSTSITQNSPTLQPRRRLPISTERTASTQTNKTRNKVIMVEKVQHPSGFIHWTVAVIPLACVIAVLICVIAFLLWRLKQKPWKRNCDVTVNAIHYDVQTRSILSQEGKENNLRGANQMRVHFQEPSNHEGAKYHTLTQATDKPGDAPIPRRLAIRRKDSTQIKGKYPLNASGYDCENEGESERSSEHKSDKSDGCRERLSREYPVVASDYDEPGCTFESDQENPEKPDCSEDEISYLEIIP